jgi:hypothetical protein
LHVVPRLRIDDVVAAQPSALRLREAELLAIERTYR